MVPGLVTNPSITEDLGEETMDMRRAEVKFDPSCDPESTVIHIFFRENPEKMVPLEFYLKKFAKQGAKVNTANYLLQMDLEKDRASSLTFEDADFVVSLRSKFGEEMALLGYEVFQNYHGIENVPLIKQLQASWKARKIVHPFLKDIKWERMLVDIFSTMASDKGYEHVLIQPAEQNFWYSTRFNECSGGYPDSIEDHQRRMRMRYNVTAERSGFVLDRDIGAYIKRLR